jgi:hypothetical protein
MENRQVNQILQILIEADVLHMKDTTFSLAPQKMPQFLPLWYYRKKFIRAFKRYIPENYAHIAISNVETIPIKHSG